MAFSQFPGTSDWASATAVRTTVPVCPKDACAAQTVQARCDSAFSIMYGSSNTPDWQGRRRWAAMLVVAAMSSSAMLGTLAAFQRF